MRTEELLSWLFNRTSGEIRWGLDRTRRLLAGVGNPHRHFHALHVGGTNGKGSVASFCTSVLRVGGRHRVGLYTSPHLVSFSERIQVDGQPVSDELLLQAAERLRPAIEETGATFFEATTALAFLCFAEAGVDVAVVEVGLGGRLDATNVLSPVAVAITNVAREHTEFLGETLEGIAREKGGILKPGVPAVTGVNQAEPLKILRSRAAEIGAPLSVLDEVAGLREVETGIAGTRVDLDSRAWGKQTLHVPMVGKHQARNALLAVELLALLPEDLRPTWSEVARGISAARWPGRLQVERLGTTTWVFDVAHNPASVGVLTDALEGMDLPRPWVLVAGVLSDKEWKGMLPPLVQRVDAAVLSAPSSAPPARRWNPEEAAQWLRSTHGTEPRVIPELSAALQRASTLAPHGTVLVTGSVYTVGDAMAALGISTT